MLTICIDTDNAYDTAVQVLDGLVHTQAFIGNTRVEVSDGNYDADLGLTVTADLVDEQGITERMGVRFPVSEDNPMTISIGFDRGEAPLVSR